MGTRPIGTGGALRTLGILSVFSACMLASPLWAQGPAEPPELPAAKLDPRARAQTLGFLPYVSLMNPIRAAESGVGDVLLEVTKLKELKDNTFDADPVLQRTSRELFSFLVRSGDRKRPEPAPSMDPGEGVDPDVRLAIALMQAIAEAAKESAYAGWLNAYDDQCRRAYRDLMPLVRRVAEGDRVTTRPVQVRATFTKEKWVYLEALNESGRDLTNVTLAVRVESIDGSSLEHFYFLPEWKAEHKRYPLRLTLDWAPGAMGTTAAKVELVSDQLVTGKVACELDDNVPTAAGQVLDAVEALIRSKRTPRKAVDRLESIGGALGRHPDLARRKTELLAEARLLLKSKVDPLDDRINKLEADVEKLRKTPLRNDREGPRRQAEIEKLNKQIAALKKERTEWVTGKR